MPNIKLFDRLRREIVYRNRKTITVKTEDGGRATAYFTSGTLEVTENGVYDVTDKAGVDVQIAGGGSQRYSYNDVNFIDFDGTIVFSCSAAEFSLLHPWPDNPEHDGLIAQGWNWSQQDALDYVEDYEMLDIGQMYTTDDGSTRLVIEVDGRFSVSVGFHQDVSEGVTVDWGDSTIETYPGADYITAEHEYSHNRARYTIKLTPSNGCTLQLGAKGPYSSVINNQPFYGMPNERSILRELYIGRNVLSVNRICYYSQSCRVVTIPNTVTEMGEYTFCGAYDLSFVCVPSSVTGNLGASLIYYTQSLVAVSLPAGVTAFYGFGRSGIQHLAIPPGVAALGANCCEYDSSLNRIAIPNGVTSIGESALVYGRALTKIVVPASVTSIAARAFNACEALGILRFEGTTPPTVAAANAFTGIPTTCIIQVPAASLAAYQSARYYPSSSTYTYEGY